MIRRLLERYNGHKLDPVEFCRTCLARQNERSYFNAFITVTDEKALEQAAESKQRFHNRSPRLLEGVPIAIKDNFSTENVKTSCASKMLDNYVPPYSATAVRRLENAGAVIIGKTNLDEFAMGAGTIDSYYGPARSPWSDEKEARDQNSDKWLVTSGSSGGSAAAVASGVVLGALGSDTGGSTRSPGAMLGIAGYKPSYGLFSRYGLIPLVNSLDCVSILAPTPEDCALLSEALLQDDGILDDSTVIKYGEWNKLRRNTGDKICIGVPNDYVTENTNSDVVDAWQIAIDCLENEGFEIKRVSMPHTQYAIAAYSVLNAVDVSSNMSRYDGLRYGYRNTELEEKQAVSADELVATNRAEAFNDVVRSRILAGNYFSLRQNYDTYVRRAMTIRRLVIEDFDKAFSQCDILVTPVLPCSPEQATYSWFQQDDNRTRVEHLDVFTQPANLAGVPAISVPISDPKTPLPRSVQMLAPRGCDAMLLDYAQNLFLKFFPDGESNLQKKFNPLL